MEFLEQCLIIVLHSIQNMDQGMKWAIFSPSFSLDSDFDANSSFDEFGEEVYLWFAAASRWD